MSKKPQALVMRRIRDLLVSYVGFTVIVSYIRVGEVLFVSFKLRTIDYSPCCLKCTSSFLLLSWTYLLAIFFSKYEQGKKLRAVFGGRDSMSVISG